jgi:hypothetical protein
MTTITKNHAIREYRKYSGADAYMMVMIQNKEVYMMEQEEFLPRYMVLKPASKTHKEKLQVNLKAAHRKEMIKKGAIHLMSEAEFKAVQKEIGLNRGWTAEKVVYDYFGVEWDGPDQLRFDKGGDLEINGKQYQIKFQNAQVVTVDTIHKVQKEHREMRKAQRMSAADEIASWLNL